MTTPETKTYSGGCHCGAVRFDVELALDKVAACNCSICSRRGYLLAFAPASALHVKQGADAQTVYQFGKKKIDHMFCKTCGVTSYGTGTGANGERMASINVRCLDDVDATALPIQHFDGKSL